jgi:hypothetical protein
VCWLSCSFLFFLFFPFFSFSSNLRTYIHHDVTVINRRHCHHPLSFVILHDRFYLLFYFALDQVKGTVPPPPIISLSTVWDTFSFVLVFDHLSLHSFFFFPFHLLYFYLLFAICYPPLRVPSALYHKNKKVLPAESSCPPRMMINVDISLFTNIDVKHG